jgi:hypothetical protein
MLDALAALHDLPVPIVAAVNGPAAGASIGLILAADIASNETSFSSAYGKIGLSPDCGISALLPAAVRSRRAAVFTLTDATLSARDALDWGLVTQVCPGDRFGPGGPPAGRSAWLDLHARRGADRPADAPLGSNARRSAARRSRHHRHTRRIPQSSGAHRSIRLHCVPRRAARWVICTARPSSCPVAAEDSDWASPTGCRRWCEPGLGREDGYASSAAPGPSIQLPNRSASQAVGIVGDIRSDATIESAVAAAVSAFCGGDICLTTPASSTWPARWRSSRSGTTSCRM